MKVFTLIFLQLISFQVMARKIKPQEKNDKSLRVEMNQISQKIRELGPIIASESEFAKVSNKNLVIKSINELQTKFKDLKKHPTIELTGLSINQMIMSEELRDVANLVEKGKASQGRAKLLSTLNLCVSCHSQSPGMKTAKLFSDSDISKFSVSNFEKAELYFVTRDYEKAMSLYSEFLNQSKVSDDDELLLKALDRELIYYVKIKKDFALGKSFFEGLLKNKKFSAMVAHEVSDWVKMLSGKTLWDNFDPKIVKEEEMDKFLKQFITDDEEGPIFTATNSSEVYDLNLSTILLDYYNVHPESKIGGKILYWLAILDKRINDDLFFSVGDFYLMACMEKYSKDPIAHDCYENYVDELEINFETTDKKQDAHQKQIKLKLERLKKLINYQEAEED